MALVPTSMKVSVSIGGRDEFELLNGKGVDSLDKALSLLFPTAKVMYSARAHLKATAAGASFNLGAGTATTGTAAAGARQVETFTAAGNITLTGSVTATLTAAGMPGSPLAIQVPVVAGDLPAAWGAKVRNAAANHATVKGFFDVSGEGAATILTKKDEAADDPTLQLQVTAGTAANANLPINSANTTAGVAPSGTVLTQPGGEIRGTAIPAATGLKMVLLVATGGPVTVAGGFNGNLGGNSLALFAVTDDGTLHPDWLLDAPMEVTTIAGACVLDVVVFSTH